jgi:23S rRNA G2445 N2-methylase RlmL
MENQFFASCPIYLEPLLVQELKALNIDRIKQERGGVSFETDDLKLIKFILQTRISSRVLKKISSRQFSDEKDLYTKYRDFSWEKLLGPEDTFKIKTVLDQEVSKSFKNSLYLSLLLKDALVDRISELRERRPNVEKKDPDYPFLLRVSKKDQAYQAELLLDLCGTPLSNRYYRIRGHDSPLRENLAAGLVLLTHWQSDRDIFIDSMCGSGTVLIEAALIKENIAPTYLRLQEESTPFVFQRQGWFLADKVLMKAFEDEIMSVKLSSKKGLKNLAINQFFGFDQDPKSVELAHKTLKRAKMDSLIKVKRVNSLYLRPPGDPPGIIFCNPPYGKRLSDQRAMEKVIYQYGENLKKHFKDFHAYILTIKELRKKISLSVDQKTILKNGNIDCELVHYKLY